MMMMMSNKSTTNDIDSSTRKTIDVTTTAIMDSTSKNANSTNKNSLSQSITSSIDDCVPVPVYPSKPEGDDPSPTQKRRRICRFPGCSNTIKSQGHCQKHGAIVKRCKIANCTKQAQGKHDGMCKRHWRMVNEVGGDTDGEKNEKTCQTEISVEKQIQEVQNLGPSVYDSVLPLSVAWGGQKPPANKGKNGTSNVNMKTGNISQSSESSSDSEVMPLVQFFRDGAELQPGWHRFHERLLRFPNKPVKSVSEQLQPEEKQLILFEAMLLSGTIYTNTYSHQVNVSKDFAHAWGRERGFHTLLVTQMCERRGDLSRKRRSDVGKLLTDNEKASFRTKLMKAKQKRKDQSARSAQSAQSAQSQPKKETGETGETKKSSQQEEIQQNEDSEHLNESFDEPCKI